MFSIINTLLHRSSASPLPSSESPTELAKAICEFFDSKFVKIHDNLTNATHDENISFSEPRTDHHFSESALVMESLDKTIRKSPIKSCTLDPIPAKLLKQILPTLLPAIAKIVNLSLSSGIMPECFKTAMVFPILKKPQLDSQILNNYRPVSNLPFLSKVVERVVASQLTEYLNEVLLIEPLHSAYRQYHSTETVVMNDILMSLNQMRAVLLVLLDLSAAFDTVDHKLLTGRLRSVPQGSVLGPTFFTIYTQPLEDIVRHHNMKYHLYADYTQFYMLHLLEQM